MGGSPQTATTPRRPLPKKKVLPPLPQDQEEPAEIRLLYRQSVDKALDRAGLDTSAFGETQKQIVRKAQEEMDRLQRQGALTISRKDQIVAKACRAVLDTYEGGINYIFYSTKGNLLERMIGESSNFTKQAEWRKKQVEAGNGLAIMKPTDTRAGFAAAWNSMASGDAIWFGDYKVEITPPKAYIFTHSNGHSLILQDGSDTEAFSVDGRSKGADGNGPQTVGILEPIVAGESGRELQQKQLQQIALMSCNSGHLDIMQDGKNIAQQFARLGNCETLGYDGNLGFGFGEAISSLLAISSLMGISPQTGMAPDDIAFPRRSHEQKSFYDNAPSGRQPEGLVAYYPDGTYQIRGGWEP